LNNKTTLQGKTIGWIFIFKQCCSLVITDGRNDHYKSLLCKIRKIALILQYGIRMSFRELQNCNSTLANFDFQRILDLILKRLLPRSAPRKDREKSSSHLEPTPQICLSASGGFGGDKFS